MHRVTVVPVKVICNAIAPRDILYNCVFPSLWPKFVEDPHMVLMVRGAHIFEMNCDFKTLYMEILMMHK